MTKIESSRTKELDLLGDSTGNVCKGFGVWKSFWALIVFTYRARKSSKLSSLASEASKPVKSKDSPELVSRGTSPWTWVWNILWARMEPVLLAVFLDRTEAECGDNNRTTSLPGRPSFWLIDETLLLLLLLPGVDNRLAVLRGRPGFRLTAPGPSLTNVDNGKSTSFRGLPRLRAGASKESFEDRLKCGSPWLCSLTPSGVIVLLDESKNAPLEDAAENESFRGLPRFLLGGSSKLCKTAESSHKSKASFLSTTPSNTLCAFALPLSFIFGGDIMEVADVVKSDSLRGRPRVRFVVPSSSEFDAITVRSMTELALEGVIAIEGDDLLRSCRGCVFFVSLSLDLLDCLFEVGSCLRGSPLRFTGASLSPLEEILSK